MIHISTNFMKPIPYLYDQQYKSNPIAYARYHIEDSEWEWLVLEYSKNQKLFYGLILPEEELLYFTIQDLQKAAYDYGVDIELDTSFKPTALKEIIDV